MTRVGLCLPNGGDLGLDQWARFSPGAALVMEGQAGAIPDIRRALPTARVYLRVEMSGKAWDPIDAGVSPEEYGRYCAVLANAKRPDCLVPANEMNIEWRSLFSTPDATAEQYRVLATYFDRLLAEYRRYSDVPIQFPANSPGHQEDDGILGGHILAPVAALYDELGLHTYWPKGGQTNEWFGGRWQRLLDVYQPRPNQRVTITEFNREAAGDDDTLASEIAEWVASLSPRISDVLWFIGDSPDQSFSRLTLRGREPLLATFERLNTDKEPMSNIGVSISLDQSPDGIGITIKTDRVVAGGFTVLLHVDPKADGFAHAVDQYRFVGALSGKAGLRFDRPDVPAGVGGSVEVHFLGFENGQTVTGDTTLRIDRFDPGSGSAPAPVLPEPVADIATNDKIRRIIGDAVNALDTAYSEQRERLLDVHRELNGEPLAFPQAR